MADAPTKPYTPADLPQLKADLLSTDGLWGMLKKDLEQIIEMPSHFDQRERPELGCGPNLSLMMVAMGGLEAMATLANLNDIGSKSEKGERNASDNVKYFTNKYFRESNPLYTPSKTVSLAMVIWDAYRNGGLHNFLPKRTKVKTNDGKKELTFAICWFEKVAGSGSRQARTLDDIRSLRATGGPKSRHLRADLDSNGDVVFWVCAPVFTLELIDAVDKWTEDLETEKPLQDWFLIGASKLDEGLAMKNFYRSCPRLMGIVNEAFTARPPQPNSE